MHIEAEISFIQYYNIWVRWMAINRKRRRENRMEDMGESFLLSLSGTFNILGPNVHSEEEVNDSLGNKK